MALRRGRRGRCGFSLRNISFFFDMRGFGALSVFYMVRCGERCFKIFGIKKAPQSEGPDCLLI